MNLLNGTLLQGGKYRIEGVLGQGGFGITYRAVQVMLERTVAVKEFFMKDLNGRAAGSGAVTVGSESSHELVGRFRRKFVKEAQMIARLNHPGIVKIIDVFEERGTAYYVMEYLDGESLAQLVARRGAIPEAEAVGYVTAVGDALQFIHSKHINHLDIKPSNIVRCTDGRVVLIDFGVSKQYDVTTDKGTTTTPVGISHGYSPAEQYRQGGVQQFSPQSDVYALAATLYKLLTSETPPESLVVGEDGLPLAPLQRNGVSEHVVQAIRAAMQTRKQRTQSVAEFIGTITAAPPAEKPDITMVALPDGDNKSSSTADESEARPDGCDVEKFASKKAPYWLLAMAFAAVVGFVLWHNLSQKGEDGNSTPLEVQHAAGKNKTHEPVSDRTFTVNDVSFTMVAVEGGTFTMGATPEQGSDAESNEKPAHQVTLSGYSIGQTEVTQALWVAVMGSNPSQFTGDLQRPVEWVSWEDCQSFIAKLNQLTGQNFRLPTEAEWEFAARGGNKSKGYKYAGSNTLGDVAWCKATSGDKTHAVATKSPNELGLYDMSGNVCEWCQDGYGAYSSGAQVNPTGPASGWSRVIRGGGWIFDAWYCRVSNRDNCSPSSRLNLSYQGLRLAL